MPAHRFGCWCKKWLQVLSNERGRETLILASKSAPHRIAIGWLRGSYCSATVWLIWLRPRLPADSANITRRSKIPRRGSHWEGTIEPRRLSCRAVPIPAAVGRRARLRSTVPRRESHDCQGDARARTAISGWLVLGDVETKCPPAAARSSPTSRLGAPTAMLWSTRSSVDRAHGRGHRAVA